MDNTAELEKAPIAGLIVKYSVPAILGMAVQAVYNIVDRFFIGMGVGDKGLAGVVVVFPYMLVFMAFGMLVGIGGVSAFSIFLGQKKKAEAKRTFGNSITATLVFSLALTSVGLLFTDPLLRQFGASDETLGHARDYMTIMAVGGVFQTIAFALNNFIRAQGAPMVAMATMLIGAVINLVLDPLFILVFGWGVPGAAWATIISMAVSSIWVLRGLAKTPMGKELVPGDFLPDGGILLRMFSIGVSPFLMQIAAALLNTLLNNQLRFYGGDWALSAIGVIYSVALLFLMPIFGLNQGTQPIIGYNYGAGNADRVRRVVSATTAAATAFTTLGFLVAFFFSRPLFATFLPNDTGIHEKGAAALAIFVLAYPLLGSQVAGVGYFQAIGKATHSMILSLSRQVLFLLPLIFILPPFWGVDGIWYAVPMSDFLAFVVTGVLLLRELGKLKTLHERKIGAPAPSPMESVHETDPIGNPGEVL